MKNPEYVKIKDKKYKINTDFRVAIRCENVATDSSISDTERTLAIIYLLFGDDGLSNPRDYNKLIELGLRYLKCGLEENNDLNEKPDMDLEQDIRLIEASFKSDYGITLGDEYMHWWDFYMYLNGLTDKCVLNRIRELRTYDTSQIKSIKEKNKIQKLKKRFALREKEIVMSDAQREARNKFCELAGIKEKE